MSSFTVDCLSGELYDVSIGMVIPMTIKLVSQQKFEEGSQAVCGFAEVHETSSNVDRSGRRDTRITELG